MAHAFDNHNASLSEGGALAVVVESFSPAGVRRGGAPRQPQCTTLGRLAPVYYALRHRPRCPRLPRRADSPYEKGTREAQRRFALSHWGRDIPIIPRPMGRLRNVLNHNGEGSALREKGVVVVESTRHRSFFEGALDCLRHLDPQRRKSSIIPQSLDEPVTSSDPPQLAQSSRNLFLHRPPQGPYSQ